jgi:hypothetical protein
MTCAADHQTGPDYGAAVQRVGAGSSPDAQGGSATPKAVVTRHAGTSIAAARRMIAASSSSGIPAGASVAPLCGQSAIDTVVLNAQANVPQSKLKVRGLVVGGTSLAMRFEFGAG